jgi:hypothetical protein
MSLVAGCGRPEAAGHDRQVPDHPREQRGYKFTLCWHGNKVCRVDAATHTPILSANITWEKYMKNRYAPLAVACALMVAGSAHAANLVVNGSFETGDLTGWNVVSGNVPVRADYGATDGIYAAIPGFGNGAPDFVLAQTISTTLGATYTVQFDWAATPNPILQTMLFEVKGVAGNLVSDSSLSQVGAYPTQFNNYAFNHYAFNFVADGTSTTLKFIDTSATSITIDQALDNVSVTSAVPEASTNAMLALGLGALGIAARRRKSA